MTTRLLIQGPLQQILIKQKTYSLEGLVLKLKLRHSGHLMRSDDSLEKTPMLAKIEGRRRRGRRRMKWLFQWHQQLDGHEFEQAPGVGEGQESLEALQSMGHQELNTTEQLN